MNGILFHLWPLSSDLHFIQITAWTTGWYFILWTFSSGYHFIPVTAECFLILFLFTLQPWSPLHKSIRLVVFYFISVTGEHYSIYCVNPQLKSLLNTSNNRVDFILWLLSSDHQFTLVTAEWYFSPDHCFRTVKADSFTSYI